VPGKVAATGKQTASSSNICPNAPPDLLRPGKGHPEQAQQQTQKKIQIQNPERVTFATVLHFMVEFGKLRFQAAFLVSILACFKHGIIATKDSNSVKYSSCHRIETAFLLSCHFN
jgi:hypothetical protein